MPKRWTTATLVLVLLVNMFAMVSAFLLQSILAVLVISGVFVLDLCLYYLRAVKKRRVRYPLVPPEGRGDAYLPRSNIPRPVVEDFRRLHEKQKKFKKLREMMRRRKRDGH
jgi:hypothetical protein